MLFLTGSGQVEHPYARLGPRMVCPGAPLVHIAHALVLVEAIERIEVEYGERGRDGVVGEQAHLDRVLARRAAHVAVV